MKMSFGNSSGTIFESKNLPWVTLNSLSFLVYSSNPLKIYLKILKISSIFIGELTGLYRTVQDCWELYRVSQKKGGLANATVSALLLMNPWIFISYSFENWDPCVSCKNKTISEQYRGGGKYLSHLCVHNI